MLKMMTLLAQLKSCRARNCADMDSQAQWLYIFTISYCIRLGKKASNPFKNLKEAKVLVSSEPSKTLLEY